MARVEIVIPTPVMAYVTDRLSQAFTLHRLWQEDDRRAAITKIGPRIRGAVSEPGSTIDAAFLDHFPNLEIVANFGVGYDSIDTAHAASRGIVVTNTPDVLTEEVADTALGLILMTVREFSSAERYLRAGRWTQEGPYRLTPGTMRDKTLGIFGLGRIGKAIAGRAEAFGLAIGYHGRHPQPGVAYRYHDSLIGLARASDILVSAAPGGAPTRNAIDAKVLEALGSDGFLISIGRGSVVDQTALIAALERGTIAAAGLDVYVDEPNVPEALIALDNAVLLPHVASASVHTRQLMGGLVVDNLRSWFDNQTALTPVLETPAKRAGEGPR